MNTTTCQFNYRDPEGYPWICSLPGGHPPVALATEFPRHAQWRLSLNASRETEQRISEHRMVADR